MGCGSSVHIPPSPTHLSVHEPSFYTFESVITGGNEVVNNTEHLSQTIDYGLWFPPHYGDNNPNTNPAFRDMSKSQEGPKVPLVIYLHGAGGRDLRDQGMDKPFSMHRLWHEYPNPLNLCNAPGDYPFALMVPHCPNGLEWAKRLMAVHVVQAVMDVAEHHNIDSSRIYVTGKSMGGEGSWKVAASCPGLFAACVPMCGGMWPYNGQGAREYGHLITMPTWVFHAEPDGHVHIKESEIAVAAVSKVNSEVKFTRYETAPDENGHDCWSRGYADEDMMKWLQDCCNNQLSEKGLDWAREEMQHLLMHRSETKIEEVAHSPFGVQKIRQKSVSNAFGAKLRSRSKQNSVSNKAAEGEQTSEEAPVEAPAAEEASVAVAEDP